MSRFLIPAAIFLALAGVLYVGVVHSPKRDGLTKLVRIEGANLDRIERSNIKAA